MPRSTGIKTTVTGGTPQCERGPEPAVAWFRSTTDPRQFHPLCELHAPKHPGDWISVPQKHPWGEEENDRNLGSLRGRNER